MNLFNFSLKKQGILGINARNIDCILAHNRRKFYPLVDDKLATKKLAEAAGVNTPKVYGVIEYQEQVKRLATVLEGHADFVIKPARGSGGSGIVVIKDSLISDNGVTEYMKGNGKTLTLSELQYHTSNVLSGLYSLAGVTDKAIIEYRIQSASFFDKLSYEGVPDIRLVVYHGVPVMAMLRLPTKASDGKANLHTGGLGVGVNIKDGVTTNAVQYNQPRESHPDTGEELKGLTIPHWKDILRMGSQFESIIGLGYIGVDIVIDEHMGPMLLEVNARPGISIQIANQSGLKKRLDVVNDHMESLRTIDDKLVFASEHF